MAVTVGVDSYVDESELTAYAAARGITITAGDESILLIRAMDYIETYPFSGIKVDDDQPLQWPRYDAYDSQEKLLVDFDVVPEKVKRAQMEGAIRASAGNLLADQSPGNVIEQTVGPITRRFADYSNDGITRYPVIDRLLRPLCGGGGRFQHQVVRS